MSYNKLEYIWSLSWHFSNYGTLIDKGNPWNSYRIFDSKPNPVSRIAMIKSAILEMGTQASIVTAIDFSNYNLTYLPDEVASLVNLLYLYINENELTSIPPVLKNLTNLQVQLLRKK